MSQNVLLIDDDISFLNVCAAHVRRRFSADVASNPNEALTLLEKQGPYAVVVSDREMPEMDGVQLLTLVRERSPDSVRVMLTGFAELDSTIAVVNQANLFRFLTKPCPPEILLQCIEDAVKQYRLVIAERELLEKTLTGSIRVLVELLAIVDPESFAHAQQLRACAGPLAKAVGIGNLWEVETAALLSKIGFITVPTSITRRNVAAEQLGESERALVSRVPEIGEQLLGNIPRLESIVAMIRYQQKHFDGTGPPVDTVKADAIPIGARVLFVLDDYLRLTRKNPRPAEALDTLRRRKGFYDPGILDTWEGLLRSELADPGDFPTVVPLAAKELRTGDRLATDLATADGLLLLRAGQELSPAAVEKIRNFLAITKLREPVLVTPGAAHAS